MSHVVFYRRSYVRACVPVCLVSCTGLLRRSVYVRCLTVHTICGAPDHASSGGLVRLRCRRREVLWSGSWFLFPLLSHNFMSFLVSLASHTNVYFLFYVCQRYGIIPIASELSKPKKFVLLLRQEFRSFKKEIVARGLNPRLRRRPRRRGIFVFSLNRPCFLGQRGTCVRGIWSGSVSGGLQIDLLGIRM